jgi:hypothetical protein
MSRPMCWWCSRGLPPTARSSATRRLRRHGCPVLCCCYSGTYVRVFLPPRHRSAARSPCRHNTTQHNTQLNSHTNAYLDSRPLLAWAGPSAVAAGLAQEVCTALLEAQSRRPLVSAHVLGLLLACQCIGAAEAAGSDGRQVGTSVCECVVSALLLSCPPPQPQALKPVRSSHPSILKHTQDETQASPFVPAIRESLALCPGLLPHTSLEAALATCFQHSGAAGIAMAAPRLLALASQHPQRLAGAVRCGAVRLRCVLGDRSNPRSPSAQSAPSSSSPS